MLVKGTAVAVLGAGCCPQDPGPLLRDPHIHVGVGVGAATPQGPAGHSHQGRPEVLLDRHGPPRVPIAGVSFAMRPVLGTHILVPPANISISLSLSVSTFLSSMYLSSAHQVTFLSAIISLHSSLARMVTLATLQKMKMLVISRVIGDCPPAAPPAGCPDPRARCTAAPSQRWSPPRLSSSSRSTLLCKMILQRPT